MGERPTPPEIRRLAREGADETLKGNPFIIKEKKNESPQRPDIAKKHIDESVSENADEDFAREIPFEKLGLHERDISTDKEASANNAREFKYGFSEAGIVNALMDGKIEVAGKLIHAGLGTSEFADGKAVRNELTRLHLVTDPTNFTLGGRISSLGEYTVPVELTVQGKTRRVELKFEVLDYGKSGVVICKDARVKLGKL